MTIEYKDSKRIVALSTDIADTATFEDDFSGADNWTDTGSGWGVNTTTDVIDFNADSPHNVTEGLYYDLGSALSSVFTIRFKLTIANFNVGSSSIENHLYFGVSDSTSHVRTQTQDIIGIHSTHWTGGNAVWKTMTANNAALPATRDYTFTHALQAETLYVQIKSLSSSQFQVDFYSDSGYSTLIESSGAQSHSATGLRYLKFQQRDNAPSGDDHTLNGTIDDVEVYDGATTNKPSNAQDNSLLVEKDIGNRFWYTPNTVTFQSDFSSSTGWTTTGSKVSIDTTNEEIDFSFNTDNGDLSHTYYDLTSVSDTKWVLRSQIDIDTVTQGIDVNDVFIFFGIGSTNQNGNESQDFLGLMFRVDNTKTDIFAIETDGTDPNNETTTLFTRQLQAETLYVEMIRESATSFTINLYSNSGYSTLLESKTITVPSSVQTLRYLKVAGLQGFSDSQIVGSVSNITLYDGVTAPAIWINEFGVSDGLMFGGTSTSSYANYSDSQSWNGVSWTAGGGLTAARQNGASAGTGSTSARYVNGFNASPAPYPNSNRNESYNGTSWTSDTVHPDSVNNKIHGGCGTADSMLVSGGHKNGTGDINNYYKWTGSWTSIAASGVSGAVSTSGTLNSALLTKTTSARTWNGTSWSTSTATSTSRTTASKSGISSSSGIRLFDWANTNPFNNTSEIWNGTSWSASGNTPSGRTDAGDIDVSTESMMTLGGQESFGGTTHSTTVYELRKGVFTTGASFSTSRRGCGGAGS